MCTHLLILSERDNGGDFPGGAVAETALPMHGAWVLSLVWELDPTCHN